MAGVVCDNMGADADGGRGEGARRLIGDGAVVVKVTVLDEEWEVGNMPNSAGRALVLDDEVGNVRRNAAGLEDGVDGRVGGTAP